MTKPSLKRDGFDLENLFCVPLHPVKMIVRKRSSRGKVFEREYVFLENFINFCFSRKRHMIKKTSKGDFRNDRKQKRIYEAFGSVSA